MASRRAPDPTEVRAAVAAIAEWLRDEQAPTPDRATLAAAVRLTARTLAALAPGACVEVRIPPFAAVQCLPGPRHTRGTPPNVVEIDPRTWLRLVTGGESFQTATANGRLALSGSRAADLASHLPLLKLPENDASAQ